MHTLVSLFLPLPIQKEKEKRKKEKEKEKRKKKKEKQSSLRTFAAGRVSNQLLVSHERSGRAKCI